MFFTIRHDSLKKTHLPLINMVIFLPLLFSCKSIEPQVKYNAEIKNLDTPSINLDTLNIETNINGYDPQTIYVTTTTQTFCKGFQFTLRAGRIWVKTVENQKWHLFLKTGLPYSDEFKDTDTWFPSPTAITEIAADADTLIAFDADGCMYRCYLPKHLLSIPGTWDIKFGWPNKKQVKLNDQVENNRGWGVGVRRTDILWYEDRFGNQHHYGTMGLETLYFLAKDGQTIYFTDSGMPVDFSNTILGPENGTFVAENLSASGSTLFLINKAGEMYTRLIDFDTMGCDPMFFKYTYKKEKQPYKGSDYRSNFTHWALPNEDWKKQPEIKLTGKARLSKFISITQNGQGNNARSLRVAGFSSEGKPGYYSKQISDKEWKFSTAPLVLPAKDLLPLALPDALVTDEIKNEKAALSGKSPAISYKGSILDNGQRIPGIICSIPDFTLTSEGKCTLVITKGSETKRLTLYPVEMWTYMERYDPGRDGTPKNYFITSSVDKEALETHDKEFGAVLTAIFGGKDKKLFAFSAEATVSYIEIYTNENKNRNGYALFMISQPAQDYTLLKPDDYKTKEIRNQPIIDRYYAADLLLPAGSRYSFRDGLVIAKKIEDNKKYIQTLKDGMIKGRQDSQRSNMSRWGYNAADLIATVTLLNQIDFPKIKTVTSFGGDIMATNAENYAALSEYRSFTYPYLIELVELRIKSYEKLLDTIKGQDDVSICPALKNTYPEYYSSIGLPKHITGFSPSADCKALITQPSSIPVLGCLALFLDDDKKSGSLFIDMPEAAEQIYRRGPKENSTEQLAKKPLTINITFYKTVDNSSPLQYDAGILNLTKKSGKLEWNGSELKIWVRTGIFSKKLLFRGTATGDENDI